jgi:hypothetical protein
MQVRNPVNARNSESLSPVSQDLLSIRELTQAVKNVQKLFPRSISLSIGEYTVESDPMNVRSVENPFT